MMGPKISKTLLAMMLISVIAMGSTCTENITMDKAQSSIESARQKVDSPISKVGSLMDDSTITAKVEATLVDHGSTKNTDISVKTGQKAVTLSGSVESQVQAEEAVKVARGVGDVTSVSDKLYVRDSKDASVKGYAGDVAITSEVKVKPLTGDIVPSRKVKAETADDIVQLSGTIDSQTQSGHTGSTTKVIDGMKGVKNDLKTR